VEASAEALFEALGIKGYASGFCEQFSAARVTTASQNA